ncbi:MAG: DinB family protein [Desulfomonile tiedjei]|nr:DinB family protein [Desulfomonile tiedjei]
MKADDVVREELLALLAGGNAHMGFDDVIANFPLEHINTKAPNTPYSFWHFVEHIRIAQWDILEFIRNTHHVSPEYPEGYRPHPDETTDEKGWRKSIDQMQGDLKALKDIVRDRKTDLFAPIPHAPNYTIFREIVLAADHNAYHVAEIAIMRQILDIWPDDSKYLTGKPD